MTLIACPSYIFLLGPSGSGKSTLGPLLAQRLNFQFIDTDQWIEKQYGHSVSAIFQDKGETYFRILEKKFFLESLPLGPLVIACGGGTVTIPGLCEALIAKGLVLALEAKPENLALRLHNRLDHRPLLQIGSLEDTLRQQIQDRQPLYEKIRYRIPTDFLSPQELRDQILDLYTCYCLSLP